MNSSRPRGTIGLSLIELLVVVTILSALALSTLALVDNTDDQFRYDDTKIRLEKVRSAILGPQGVAVGNQLVVSGFVADIGRLPNNLEELVERGALPSWGLDPTTGVEAGWRGPYLAVLPDVTGQKHGNLVAAIQ